MNIKINSIHFDADAKLEDYIHSKVSKMIKFYEGIVSAEIFLRLEKKQNQENKITEIKLEIPGTDLFVKKQSKSFEESTTEAIDALTAQLKKFKEKQRGL
jgi:putative sigma-54 modulation protein